MNILTCTFWLWYKLNWRLAAVCPPHLQTRKHHSVTIPRNLNLLRKHWCIYYTSLGQPGTRRPHLCSPQLCLVNPPTGLFVWIWLIGHSVCVPTLVPCGICLSRGQRVLAGPARHLVCSCKILPLACDGTSIVFQASSLPGSDSLRGSVCKI